MLLLEQNAWSDPQIDEENGVIRGVKILGSISRNGRRYTQEAISKAIPLYERAGVNLDHVQEGKRKVVDGFGRLSNVALKGDDLFGDIEYLKTHQFAPQFVEAAKRMPEQLGLSHTAEGKVRHETDGDVVEELTVVQSVDIVRYPATTKGLFEAMDIETDACKMHLRAAMAAVLEDHTLSMEEVIKKITVLMKTEEKVLGDKPSENPVPEGVTPPEPPIAPDNTALVEMQTKLTTLEQASGQLQHRLDLSECLHLHHIDVAEMSEQQWADLRSKTSREEMDTFAESLPKVVRQQKPGSGGRSPTNYQQLREELKTKYSFK